MVYIDLVLVLNFAVDFLLLWATDRLSGSPARYRRYLLSALLGGLYGGACVLPGFQFLAGSLWRILVLALMSAIAFGLRSSTLRQGILFILLSMALGGIAINLGTGGIRTPLACILFLMLLAVFGLGNRVGQHLLPVEIVHRGCRVTLTALRDTGNTLRDPITGEPVLVADPEIAVRLLKLSPEELQDPSRMLSQFPGTRLIPYRSVGQEVGLLLGLRPDEIRIRGSRCKLILAFSPHPIGNDAYQALSGGNL